MKLRDNYRSLTVIQSKAWERYTSLHWNSWDPQIQRLKQEGPGDIPLQQDLHPGAGVLLEGNDDDDDDDDDDGDDDDDDFWKVLVDQETNNAVAFIGLNDPHRTSPPEELCSNRCVTVSAST